MSKYVGEYLCDKAGAITFPVVVLSFPLGLIADAFWLFGWEMPWLIVACAKFAILALLGCLGNHLLFALIWLIEFMFDRGRIVASERSNHRLQLTGDARDG